MSAVLVPEVGKQQDRVVLAGDVPSPSNPPPGCRFHTRCPYAMEICRQVQPPLIEQSAHRRVACHLYPADGMAPAAGSDAATCSDAAKGGASRAA